MGERTRRRTAILVGALAIVASAWLLLRRGDPDPSQSSSIPREGQTAAVELSAPYSLQGVAGTPAANTIVAPDAVRAQVIDVKSDTPVSHLEFVRGRRRVAEETVRSALASDVESAGASDGDGWLSLEKSASALPWPAPESGWRPVTTSTAEAVQTGRMHVGRVVRIVGRVRSDVGVNRELPLDGVRVALVGYGPPDARLTTPDADAPSSIRWLRQRRLDAISAHSYDPRTGAFEIRGVQLPWFGVTAAVTGWYGQPVDLSERVPDANGVIEADVVLRPRRTVRGRVLGEDGRPLQGARLRVQVLVRSTLGKFNPTRALIEGSSVTMAGDPDGKVVVNYASEYVTGSDGSYVMDVPADGEAVLVVRADSCAPARSELPTTRESTVDLTLRRRTGETVRLLNDGSPVTDTSVLLHDMTDRDRQVPLGFVPIGEDGAIRAEWLETGHDYMFELSPSYKHCFVRWRGQSVLDLAVESETPLSLDAAPAR